MRSLAAFQGNAMKLNEFASCEQSYMFIKNEYIYCTRNPIQIIEDSDNRGSDNRGSTVAIFTKHNRNTMKIDTDMH